jgi:hypothetical protein
MFFIIPQIILISQIPRPCTNAPSAKTFLLEHINNNINHHQIKQKAIDRIEAYGFKWELVRPDEHVPEPYGVDNESDEDVAEYADDTLTFRGIC